MNLSARKLAGRLSRATVLRFAVVGCLGTATNALVFFAMVDAAGLPAGVGAVGAFAVAVSQNYLLNQRWTFGAWGTQFLVTRYLKFVAASLGALAVDLVVLHLLLSAMAFPVKTIAQLAGIASGAVVNYLASRYLVFVRRRA